MNFMAYTLVELLQETEVMQETLINKIQRDIMESERLLGGVVDKVAMNILDAIASSQDPSPPLSNGSPALPSSLSDLMSIADRAVSTNPDQANLTAKEALAQLTNMKPYSENSGEPGTAMTEAHKQAFLEEASEALFVLPAEEATEVSDLTSLSGNVALRQTLAKTEII